MLTYPVAIFLGLLQALTEFLPVSSSGHLALFQQIFSSLEIVDHIPLSFDVAVHGATLVATILFFHKRILGILFGLFSREESERTASWRLAMFVIVGTIPAVIVGLSIKDMIEEAFASPFVVATGFLVTTIILLVASSKQKSADPEVSSGETRLTFPKAFVIGCLQALAITPGISRSGATIAAGIVLGLSSVEAVLFSFLLAIPAILGAMVLEFSAISALSTEMIGPYVAGSVTALVGGVFSLGLLVFVIEKKCLALFAGYTAVLSAVMFSYILIS